MSKSNNTSATVVLVHAFPLDSGQWKPQLEELGGRLELLAPDLPGFGAQPGLDEQAFTMERAAEFIGRELEVRDISRCILGGLSMGGYVALECWRRFPERIAGILLADTRATADDDKAREARYAAVERIGGGGYEEYVDELLAKLLTDRTREENQELVDFVRGMMMRAIPDSVVAALLGIAARSDSTELLKTISVPVAIVCGTEDVITTRNDARMMHQLLPESSLTLIEGAGHLSNLESPRQFNAVISDLVDRING